MIYIVVGGECVQKRARHSNVIIFMDGIGRSSSVYSGIRLNFSSSH